jgi:hypothetical protein
MNNPIDEAGGMFGSATLGGSDLNADGFDDLVVGAPSQDGTSLDEGRAFVYYGYRMSVPTAPSYVLPYPSGGEGAGYGTALAGAGDLNADGIDDLVVGTPMHDAAEMDEGAAFVYLGSDLGVAPPPDVVVTDPGDQYMAFFGFAVASAR